MPQESWEIFDFRLGSLAFEDSGAHHLNYYLLSEILSSSIECHLNKAGNKVRLHTIAGLADRRSSVWWPFKIFIACLKLFIHAKPTTTTFLM
jgi:hypothetical protein